MSKNDESVYVVVRGSPDIASHFVEIRGIFKTVEEARERKDMLWDAGERPQARVEKYLLLSSGSPFVPVYPVYHFDPRPPKGPGRRCPSPIKEKFTTTCGRKGSGLWTTEVRESVTCKQCLNWSL